MFLVLFLSSSAFVDPRSWWSFYNVETLEKSTFIAKMSLEKTLIYAFIGLVLIAILNQPLVKTTLKIGVIKLQLLLKRTKALFN